MPSTSTSDVTRPCLQRGSRKPSPSADNTNPWRRSFSRSTASSLRRIEQAVLQRQKAQTKSDITSEAPEATGTVTAAAKPSPAKVDPAASVVLDYCAAVRGILNDDQGGPLHPPGVRMAEALHEVQ